MNLNIEIILNFVKDFFASKKLKKKKNNLMKMKKLIYIIFILTCSFYFSQVQKIYTWDEAKKIATEKNINILIEFTGSTWCKPCIKMEKEVINSKEFEDFYKDKFLMFVLDLEMPINMNSQNYLYFNKFKQKYSVHVYPTYILVDKNGKEIKRIEGFLKKEKFISRLENKK